MVYKLITLYNMYVFSDDWWNQGVSREYQDTHEFLWRSVSFVKKNIDFFFLKAPAPKNYVCSIV